MRLRIRIAKYSLIPEVALNMATSGINEYFAIRILSRIQKIYGSVNLLNAAKNSNCKIFVNTGSCFEYGSSDLPFKEEDMLNPLNIYGATKASATLYSKVLSKKSSFALVTLRPFTVYGPGEDKRRFISTVIKQCLEGKNPTLTRERIVRDYIYIEDVVDAYQVVISKAELLSGQIINISTGKGTALEDVVKMIMRLTDAKVVPGIGNFARREGEVLSLVGD